MGIVFKSGLLASADLLIFSLVVVIFKLLYKRCIPLVRDVPWGVNPHEEGGGLKSLENLDIRVTG